MVPGGWSRCVYVVYPLSLKYIPRFIAAILEHHRVVASPLMNKG